MNRCQPPPENGSVDILLDQRSKAGASGQPSPLIASVARGGALGGRFAERIGEQTLGAIVGGNIEVLAG